MHLRLLAVISSVGLAALASAGPTSLEGTWKSLCLNAGEQDGKARSAVDTLRCSTTVCDSNVDFYWGTECKGALVNSNSNSMAYEIERPIGDDLYDIKVSLPADARFVCFSRIKLRSDKLYLAFPPVGDSDCSTPEDRTTTINEAEPLTKVQ